MMVRISARWFVAAMVLTVVIAASIDWLRRDKTETSEVFASASGRVEATEYEITMKRASRIAKVLVHEGDTVEPGQIVAEMETRDVRAEERQAEAELRHAREELNQAKLIIAQKKSDLEQAMASLAQREREFVLAKDQFERSRELLAKDLIARQELSELEGKLRIAEAALALDKARKLAAEAALKAAEFEVKRKQAAMDTAQARLQRTPPQSEDRFLRAPHRGLVLARPVEPGEVLSAASTVLRVLELNDIYMTISLPRAQAERVVVGSEARVVLDAAPHQVFPGVVAFIAPESQFTADEVKGRKDGDMSMFRVKIKIDARLIEPHLQKVKTELKGVAHVRLDAGKSWPQTLQVK